MVIPSPQHRLYTADDFFEQYYIKSKAKHLFLKEVRNIPLCGTRFNKFSDNIWSRLPKILEERPLCKRCIKLSAHWLNPPTLSQGALRRPNIVPTQ